MYTLTARKAALSDLPAIVNLLIEDELGQTREKVALPQIRGHFTHPHSTLTLNL